MAEHRTPQLPDCRATIQATTKACEPSQSLFGRADHVLEQDKSAVALTVDVCG